jgi:hypothetical protein
MRIMMAAAGATLALALVGPTMAAQAQTARTTQASNAAEADVVATPKRRPRARVRIYRENDERGVYPSYNPGPDAVRDCTATYVQEYRPSGTVIVPRMNCFWRRG